MFSIQCEELRLDHLTRLLVVTMPYDACWFLWRVDYIEDFKWCFGVAFWRGKSRLKGHWRLQFWTLPGSWGQVHTLEAGHRASVLAKELLSNMSCSYWLSWRSHKVLLTDGWLSLHLFSFFECSFSRERERDLPFRSFAKVSCKHKNI